MTLPLTKALDPVDLVDLAPELVTVDEWFRSASPQHAMRRWEYALALRACAAWEEPVLKDGPQTRRLVDVGGAGSPFFRMVPAWLTYVVDPAENCDLATYILSRPVLADVVVCLSVLEHIPADDLDRFLYHLNCLVAPGGLLFLTMDYCGDPSHADLPDIHHFHWMRKRIFSESHWQYLALNLQPYGFERFGGTDWNWSGPHVYDYSFASLALLKRP